MEPSESPQVVKGILRKPGEKREYKGEMSMATQGNALSDFSARYKNPRVEMV